MNKLKQVIFTFLLFVTATVASPIIISNIWKDSTVKTPTEKTAPPVVDVRSKAEEKPTVAIQPSKEAVTEIQEETEQSAEEVPQAETIAEETAETDIPTTENAEQPAEETPPETTASVPETTQPVTEAVFAESDDDYFDDALFIGDSRTVGISEYGTLKNADYFCSVGLASYKIDSEYVNGYSLSDLLAQNVYGKVYIMLGINEVGNNIDSTISAFSGIVQKVREKQPEAVVYIMGNLHVTQEAQTDVINNEGINALNSKMAEFADNQNIFYIDINPVFDDESGNLRSDCSSDGVHVYAKYYLNWCEWLKLHTIKRQ